MTNDGTNVIVVAQDRLHVRQRINKQWPLWPPTPSLMRFFVVVDKHFLTVNVKYHIDQSQH
jgi:hypothetical protein